MNFPKKAARALIVLLLLLAGAMAYLASTGQIISAVQNAVVTVTKPVMKLSAGISNAVSGIYDRTVNIDDIMAENEEMKKEIARIFATRICLFVPWGIPIIITRFFFLVIIELYLGKTESLISAFYTIVTKEFFCNFFTSCLDAVYIV